MKQKLSKLLLTVSSLCCAAFPVYASHIVPRQARVPGGIAVVKLDVISASPPEVRYLGNRTVVVKDPKQPQRWQAVVGIPLSAQLGTNNLEIITASGSSSKSFVISAKQYPNEKLNIKDKRKVEPLPEDLPIIEAQRLETLQTYANWEYQDLSSLALAIPVKGRKSSPFGLQRILNGIPKEPHSGLDIAAPLGTKINCPLPGKVTNVGNYFYGGNMVFVDHGQGFITSYCHLDSVAVTKGQMLQQGDIIGTVGKTGRVTGPHLHWSVSLNGVRVDPQLLING